MLIQDEEKKNEGAADPWSWTPSEGALPYTWTLEEERPRIFKSRLSTKKGKTDIPTADFKTETPIVPKELAHEYFFEKRTENWPSVLMVEQTQSKTLKTDPDEYFEKNLDNPRVLKHTSFLAMDDTGGASIEFCNQERTISGRDALAHLNRFHKYLESNWDKFEITPKLDHQQSSPEEKGTADYIRYGH